MSMIAGLQRRTILVVLMAACCGGLAIALSQFLPVSTASESVDLSPLLDFTELQLVSFTIFLQGETLDFERQPQSSHAWRMTTPESAPVSRVKVQRWLKLLASQQQDKSFTVEREALRNYGLEQPFAEVSLRFGDGRYHHLAFGFRNFDQSKVYVQVDGSLEVRVLSAGFLEAINRHAHEWLEPETIAEAMI